MKIIVTRHGLTDWNAVGRWQGHLDVPLSAEGLTQAKKLAKSLTRNNIEVIYSSPLSRALKTAEEIKKLHPKAKIVIDKDLMEINFGIFEGLTKEEILSKHAKIYAERQKDKYNYKGHKGETLSEVESRALCALDRAISAGKDCVIVSHGVINQFLLKKLLNAPIEEIKKNNYNNTNVSIFEISGEKVKVEEFNSTKHLE